MNGPLSDAPFHFDPAVVQQVADLSQVVADRFDDNCREIGGPWWAELQPKERWRLVRMYQAGRADAGGGVSVKPYVKRNEPGHYYSGGEVVVPFENDYQMQRILSCLAPAPEALNGGVSGEGEPVAYTWTDEMYRVFARIQNLDRLPYMDDLTALWNALHGAAQFTPAPDERDVERVLHAVLGNNHEITGKAIVLSVSPKQQGNATYQLQERIREALRHLGGSNV